MTVPPTFTQLDAFAARDGHVWLGSGDIFIVQRRLTRRDRCSGGKARQRERAAQSLDVRRMLAPLGGDFDGNAKFWDLEFSAAVPKVTSPPPAGSS